MLRDKLAELQVAQPEGISLPPFVGGAVGMIAYDWVRFVEKLPDDNPDEARLPDLWFSLPETVVAFDNHRHVALVVRHVRVTPGADASMLYGAASVRW